jgi:threonylcarbamoyladenosine tRNA methylthiotransferase MtaB
MRIAIATLGCKINQYDSAVIQDRLEKERHSFVTFENAADVYIVNACTVTDRADWEARQLVRRAKRLSPGARILVTGCYAQVKPQEVAQLPGVDFVVGLNRLDDLVRFVNSSASCDRPGIAVGEVKKERKVSVLGTHKLPGHTRAFLKIQEGCDYSCTYCIIPTARGRSRSVPPDEVLKQIRSLANQGFVEVVLTGIHLGGYGHDLAPKVDLTSLLERILEEGSIARLRLSSLDPREMPDRLLDLMAQTDGLCPHLHICAQAGEDRILKQMRRNYNTSYYRELILRARGVLPDAAIGSDIIVGFPGESDGDFQRSLEFFSSLPLTYFHVFPYSVRTGTVAASLADHVPSQTKKERARLMRELGTKKKREFYCRFVGERVSVLLEEAAGGAERVYRGHSRNYLSVLVRAGEGLVNREVGVAIDGLDGSWLTGRVSGDASLRV